MKKTLITSIIAASCLHAAEYNIFIASFKKDDYATLNKIKSNIEKVVNSSKYANELVVKARASDPQSVNNSTYHTVVVETADMSKSKVTEIRNYLRSNSIYKDAYFTTRKPNEPKFSKVDSEVDTNLNNDELTSEPTVVDNNSSVSSMLDSLDEKNDNGLNIPAFNNVEDANSITLNKMIASVLDTNPSVNTYKQEYLKSLKDLDIASAEYYPMLNVYANGGYVNKKKKVNVQPEQKGTGTTHDASIVLTENLFNGGKDMNGKAQQSHITNSTAYKVIQNSNEIVYDSTKAYLDMIKTKLLLEIAQKNVKAHEDIYALIKDRTSSGFARASEERQAGSRLALAKNNLLSAENDFKDAESRFTRLFGKNVDINSLVMPEFTYAIPSSVEGLNEISKKCNPSVRIQAENINVLEYETKVKKGNYLPKLDLELSANYAKDKIFRDLQADTKDTSAGAYLRFSYNLFNKGQDKLNVEKSKIGALASQMDYNATLRELEESNSYAFNSYKISNDKLNYLNDYVEYAKSTLLTYEDEFKIGKRDLINVLDAQSEYFSAAKELINTKSNILLTQYKMLDNMGVISEGFVNGYAKQYINKACSISDIK
ncbi:MULTISPECIES: TolC family protein [unclassified Campylobacter]|uniref:TolC family protein n=1 Tax=unclassified Campylobacter TaxID=2593542 RepID=UPI001BD99888|nr:MULTISPECIES: TolC family protein [unclassified Campylobacter]MBT0881380.1 TolC family protein [Campylobacter sp. 2018MI27]MBT0885352.1 TolC family protein [Campylobacter sp. 2018MI10]MBZ7977655.1 TolC family protein [Campylobacter sp. RM12654]